MGIIVYFWYDANNKVQEGVLILVIYEVASWVQKPFSMCDQFTSVV